MDAKARLLNKMGVGSMKMVNPPKRFPRALKVAVPIALGMTATGIVFAINHSVPLAVLFFDGVMGFFAIELSVRDTD